MNHLGVKPTLLKGPRAPALEDRATVLSVGTTRVLGKLGLLDSLTGKCSVITQHARLDHQGNEWGRVNFRELAALHGFPHIVIPNSVLYPILEDKIGNIPTLPHSHITGLEHYTEKGTNAVKVRVKRTEVRPPSSKEVIEDYDLIVGADGLQSDVRSLVWKPSELRTTLLLGRYSTIISRPPSYPVSQIVEMWGPGNSLCVAPIGDNKLVVWGLFKPENLPTHLPPRTTKPMSEFIKQYDLYSGPWQTIRKELEKKEYAQLDYFTDTKVHGRPVYSRVGLIGQAARGIMPILHGHDVQQAVEDAVILAQKIAGDVPLDQVLPSYIAVREGKANSVQLAASTVVAAVITTRQDWKMKLKYYLLKADNTSKRITERENKLIGFDPDRLKVRKF